MNALEDAVRVSLDPFTPPVILLPAPLLEADAFATQLQQRGCRVAVLSRPGATNQQALLHTLRRVCDFEWFFGYSWQALDAVLRTQAGSGCFCLIYHDPAALPPTDLRSLLDVFVGMSDEWRSVAQACKLILPEGTLISERVD